MRVELAERGLPRMRMRAEAGVEFDAILEAAIHALAVKRHDGVRGVADERG